MNNFKELIDLIPKLKDSVELGLKRELKKHKQQDKILKMDRTFMKEVMNLLQGKWTVDIIFMIFFQKNPFYNDLRKSLPEVNTRTLTIRLKYLEKKGIIERNVQNGRPVRVSYKITPFGKGLTYLVFPSLIYIILEQDKDVLKSTQ